MEWFFPASAWACRALALGAGVVALVLLAWAFRGDRARGRRRCPKCWYDMNAATGLICPECGRDARTPAGLLRPRRRKAWMLVAAALGAYAALAAWIPDYRDYGWAWRLPTWVLVRLYPWADRPDGARSISSVNRPVLIALSQRLYELDGREPQPRLAAKCLDELRTQTDALRRRDAYILIGLAGPGAVSADELIAIVTAEDDATLQGHAWNSLTAIADHPQAHAMIEARLRAHPDDTVAGLIKRLPNKGPGAAAYATVLLELIRTGTQAVPAEAAWKLMLMGPAARGVAKELAEISAAEPDRGKRAYFEGALACLEGRAESDAHVFAGWLKSDDPQLRLAGACMLGAGELHERGHSVTDELIGALRALSPEDAPGYDYTLVQALVQRGSRAERAIPLIEELAARPGVEPRMRSSFRSSIDAIKNSRW